MKIWGMIMLVFMVQMAGAQNKVPVSSTGIGEIKLNMTLAQVEKVIGQSIVLKPNSGEDYAMDTAIVTFKGVELFIQFINEGGDDNNKPQKKVYGIGANHASLQTRSGISPGHDKFDVVKKLDGMYLTLQPDWRMENKPDKAKYSVLSLTDGENGTQLLMYFENNKLTGFYVSVFEGC